jgi:hypothetical protein
MMMTMMNGIFKDVKEEGDIVSVMVHSWHSSEEAEENHENPCSG